MAEPPLDCLVACPSQSWVIYPKIPQDRGSPEAQVWPKLGRRSTDGRATPGLPGGVSVPILGYLSQDTPRQRFSRGPSLAEARKTIDRWPSHPWIAWWRVRPNL